MSTALVPVEAMSLDDLAARVTVLLTPQAPPELVADLVQSFTLAKRRMKEAEEVLDELLLQWFPENGGELVIGDTKYCPGKKSTEKVRDLKAAVMSAIELLDGNADVLATLLSSDALKAGECAKVLGPEWRAEHFQKRYTDVVEVKKLNLKYLNKGAA